jgi:acetyl-CoA acetyltransferase
VLKQILNQTNKTLPDEVIIGQALTAACGQNPARQTVLKSGLPNSVTASVNNNNNLLIIKIVIIL